MRLLLLVLFVYSGYCRAHVAHDVTLSALSGTWKCRPYTIVAKDFDVTSVETVSYADNGSFRSISEHTVRLSNGKVVRTRERYFGKWELNVDIIIVKYEKVEFLSSDDPTYSIQMGQADADAQQKKKDWAKAKILELGDKLITIPVESMYKEARIEMTCVRP